MSLMRAFTTRRSKPAPELHIALPGQLGRAASLRNGKPVYRSQISGPVALVSTTNMLSYEAPDLPGHASSSSSTSGDDSDASSCSVNTRDTATDASSVDTSSPTSPGPEPNHLSCYFKPAVDTRGSLLSRSSSVASSRAASDGAPAIPKRVPSHSKRAHENLHRKRSVQRLMSPPASIRGSADMFAPARAAGVEPTKEAPFGPELAQLDEVVEELATGAAPVCDTKPEEDVDAAFMKLHCLAHFAASDYLSEIEGLVISAFRPDEPAWF